MPRYIWAVSLAVQADNLEDACRHIEDVWGREGGWLACSLVNVEVYEPSGPPLDIIPADEEG